MTNKQKASKLKRLNIVLDNKRQAYHAAVANIVAEFEAITGEDFKYNDFPGDGLGIALDVELDSRGVDTFISIDDAIELIRLNGTISETDITTL